MAAVVVVDVLAAVALAVRATVLGHPASWTGIGSAIGGSMVAAGLALLMGAALGALLMQTAVAIVAYFVAPERGAAGRGAALLATRASGST